VKLLREWEPLKVERIQRRAKRVKAQCNCPIKGELVKRSLTGSTIGFTFWQKVKSKSRNVGQIEPL
jgi:hypothetical protein